MTGDELKKVRGSLGLSQESFAKHTGVHRVTVAKWETGVWKIPPFVEWAMGLLRENRHLKQQLNMKGAKKPYGRIQKKG